MNKLYIGIAIVLLIILSGISLFIGVSTVTLDGLLSGDSKQLQTFMVSRIPRLIAIIIAGMSMSVVGLIMQQLARNKFVSPSTAGTMESATLGILISSFFFSSTSVLGRTAVSFVFALIGTMIFMKILDYAKYKDVIFVPLVGIMFGSVIGSITTFIALRYDMLQSLGAWMAGSFAGILSGRYEMLYIAVPTTIVAYLYADRFTLAGMGEHFSTNLGLNYKQVMNIGLAITALSTAVVVLTVGVIPFLGLVVPNVVTIIFGDNLKRTLPLTALAGSLFVLICDIFGRLVRYPYEIPISLVVGIVGSIIFIYLITKRGAYASKA